MQTILSKAKTSGFKLIWKARMIGGDADERKFLIFDLETGTFSWAAASQDQVEKVLHPIAQILRKYVDSARVTRVGLLNEQTFVELEKAEGRFYLIAARDSLELINDHNESFFRWSKKGFYSKRKETTLPAELELLIPQDDLFQTKLHKAQVHQERATLSPEQRLLRDKLARRRKTLSKAYEKQKRLIPTQSEIEQLEELANYFTENFATQNLLEATERFPQFEFASQKSWGQNLDEIHKQLKKKRKAVTEPHFASSQKELMQTEKDLHEVRENQLSPEQIALIARRHRIRLEKPKSPESGPRKPEKEAHGRKFTAKSGAEIYVARSAEEGDLLVKHALSNDYWFHVVSGTGGHVIVRRKSLPDKTIDMHTLREALILAVHFSGHAASRSAEVYTSEKAGLRKRKNAPAGLWEIVRASSLMVRYEKSELDDIFNRAS